MVIIYFLLRIILYDIILIIKSFSCIGGIAAVKKHYIFLFFVIALSLFASCKNNSSFNAKNPITLTIWHNYGGQMKNTMDEMIDDFNRTIGHEKGIILNVTSISGSAYLQEKLLMIVNGDPDAPNLPDITTCYPGTASKLYEKGMLSDIGTLFNKNELSEYIPEYIEEGRLKDEKLYVFPVAKSTEVMFVNATIFNRFMRDNDVSYEDLKTFEGINKAAELYYDWTDNMTPDIKNDGKTFIVYDSIFNLAQIGLEQLGESLTNGDSLNFSSSSLKKVWNIYFEPAVKGYAAIFDGYGSDLSKTGDAVCSIGSTAGVLFYPSTITYDDNVTEAVEYIVLPYPVFKGGKNVAIQRGSGMCVAKSTHEKEYAAGIFLKWFTSPEQNLRFIASTGYLPVTKKAFEKIMSEDCSIIANDKIKKLISAEKLMYADYDFYIPPVIDNIDAIQKKYDASVKEHAKKSRKLYIEYINSMDRNKAFERASENTFFDFVKNQR